jgi:phenylacetaldehyde dehydrogenase
MTSTSSKHDVLNFINGQHQAALDGSQFQKHAPATGALLASVAASKPADVDLAVQAATAALKTGPWATMPAAERGKLMLKLADLVQANAQELAQVQAEEQGRPVFDMTMMDLPMSQDTLRYFAGWADKLEGRTIPTAGFMGRKTLNYTRMDPVGVAALIIPWNAPLMITFWKLAPALAAGCTVVIKTSEDAPLAVARLGALFAEAGFPAGVINIVHGIGPEAGAALTAHPGVAKISFTGSTTVGRIIARQATDSFKRVTLELGGKAAQILLKDANLEEAVPGVAMGLFVNQGQTCAAGSRVLVHRSLVAQVETQLAAMASSMKLGGHEVEGAQMGALISERHLARVKASVDAAVAEGARMICGGEGELPASGYFMRPTVFTDVNATMGIAREEIFGPVGAIIPFDTEEEAIAMANDCQYGLSASVWTRDVSAAHRVSAQLEVGAVAVNCWSPLDARLPWGGLKDSGVGRDLSRKALDSFLEEKLISLAL